MHIYDMRFPKEDLSSLGQNEAYFVLQEAGSETKVRFHDYSEIYKRVGLYEQIFYHRLKCNSPSKVASVLGTTLKNEGNGLSELRVLDLGAGNGMVGEELRKIGIARLIGVDIIKEAAEATKRDRPGLYDAYYVEDFVNLDKAKRAEIASWQCNCLITVAALGFGDIPAKAFVEAFNLISDHGWIVLNIKETFLNNSDNSGFSKLIRELIFSEYLDIHHMERYRHRLSIEGKPLFYFAIAARKNTDIPADFLASKTVDAE